MPTNPPITLLGPVLATAPDAVESWIRLLRSLIAAKPPSVLLSAPTTAPVADELLIVPWLLIATKPPIELPEAPVTAPAACELSTVPPFVPTNPPILLFWPVPVTAP